MYRAYQVNSPSLITGTGEKGKGSEWISVCIQDVYHSSQGITLILVSLPFLWLKLSQDEVFCQ